MGTDERPKVGDQAETDQKQFPVADVLLFLDSVESAFHRPFFALQWRSDLFDLPSFEEAIKDHPEVSDRIALCRHWAESIQKHIGMVKGGGIVVPGLTRSFETLRDIIRDIESTEFPNDLKFPPFFENEIKQRGLRDKLNYAVSDVRSRLRLAATAPDGSPVNITAKTDGGNEAPATENGRKTKSKNGRASKKQKGPIREPARKRWLLAWRAMLDHKDASNADIAELVTGGRKNSSLSDFLTKYVKPVETEFEQWEVQHGPLDRAEW